MSVTRNRSQEGIRKNMKRNVNMAKNICKILGPLISTLGESLEPSSSSQWSVEWRKRPVSSVNSDNSEDDAKRFCSENQHILKELSNTAPVLNNCQFSFTFHQKCMSVKLSACAHECEKSSYSFEDFLLRCLRRIHTHFLPMCILIVLNNLLHIRFVKNEIKIASVVLIVELIYIYIVLYLRYSFN